MTLLNTLTNTPLEDVWLHGFEWVCARVTGSRNMKFCSMLLALFVGAKCLLVASLRKVCSTVFSQSSRCCIC